MQLFVCTDILAGSCGLFNNYNLCHMKTINWEEIITGVGAKYVYVYNFTEPERECPRCDESCGTGGCWGEGPENCQKFSKNNCSPQCHQGRCFGNKPRECCHLFCAGGCTGPKQSDCLVSNTRSFKSLEELYKKYFQSFFEKFIVTCRLFSKFEFICENFKSFFKNCI